MTDSSKYSKYTHYDWSCVLILLESLNYAYNWLKSELNVVLNEHTVQEKILKKQAA